MGRRKGVEQVSLDEKEIIRLYTEEKLTIEDIRKIFNVNYATIKTRLVRNNIQLRSTSESKILVMNRPEVLKNVSEASKRSAGKRKETNIERYGVAVASNNPEKRKEWEQKYLEEHGVKWNEDPQRIEKRKETNLERYGVENVTDLQEVKDKISQNRWKNKTEEELKEIDFKKQQSYIKNLNATNPLKNQDIKNKVRESRWLNKSEEDLQLIQDKCDNTRIQNMTPIILNKLKELNLELLDNFDNVITFKRVKCLKCNTIFETVLDYVFHNYGLCPKCFPKNTSIWEREIIEYIKSLEIEIITSTRKVLNSGKELDIFIPSKNIAIECDGLYYHCDDMISDTLYHRNKTHECLQQNINLIHIFEDEWYYKKDIVKSRLKQILNINSSTRIHARQCIIKEILYEDKNIFLDQFHIQGKDNSVIKLGAFYNDELVSVMTFGHGNISKGSKSIEGVWELNRFCSSSIYHIPGIASKLLSYFKLNYEWKEIFSYADRRWSTGNLYNKLGFIFDSFTKPNYWYIKSMKRIHRFSLRKRPDEPKDIPEWQLRQAEGYHRIWDCGSIKFSLKNI